MLLAALLLVPAQTVDYTTVAKPLPAVLRELSAVVGEQWRPVKALENELLVVRVRGVSREALRENVAKAVVGKWSKEGEAWVLHTDNPKLRKRADTLQRAYAKQLSEEIAEFGERTTDPAKWPDEEVAADAAEGTDGGREVSRWLLADALTQLDPFESSGRPNDDQVDYSTTSNRLQRPLRGMAPLLRRALEFQHRFADASARADIEEPEVGSYEHGLRVRAITKWQGPLRMVLRTGWSYDRFEARGYIIDGSNKVVETAAFNFSYEVEPHIDSPEVLTASSPELSPDTVLFERFAGIGRPNLLDDYDSKFVAKLLRPTIHDPLSFTVSDYATEIGRLCGWNVVVRPYDEMYLGDWDEETGTLANWLSSIQSAGSIHVTQESGWLVVGPSGFRMKTQVNRQALETLIAYGMDRLPTLSEAAKYASVSVDNLLELIYVSPFAGFYPDWTWLKFYATLPEPVRMRLWNEEEVRVRDLPAAALESLEWIVFNTDGVEDDEFWYDAMFDQPPITDALPFGIPMDTVFRAKVANDFCLLQTKPRTNTLRSHARRLDSVAEGAARSQYQGQTDGPQFPWRLAPFIVGNTREMDLSLTIGNRNFGDTLTDDDVSRRKPPVTGPPLPEAMQKSFEQAVERHLKRMREQGDGISGRS